MKLSKLLGLISVSAIATVGLIGWGVFTLIMTIIGAVDAGTISVVTGTDVAKIIMLIIVAPSILDVVLFGIYVKWMK